MQNYNILEIDCPKAHKNKLWDLSGSRIGYMGYLLPFSVQGHARAIQCICNFSRKTTFQMLILL